MDRFDDMVLFSALANKGGFSAAARELGLSTSSISRRIAALESRLGVRLLNRTTRRLSLTPEGVRFREVADRILGELNSLEDELVTARVAPRGLLRVNATFGFGRAHVAETISRFACAYPEVSIELILSDAPMDLVNDGVDLGIRFGSPPASRLVARRLLENRRYLCAAPSYLKRHGMPATLEELGRHQCIVLRQNFDRQQVWRLHRGGTSSTVKLQGHLSSNDGEVALRWVLDGHGIMLRSQWDIAAHLLAGRLRLVLPAWYQPDADIFAVYPQARHQSPRVRLFVDFLAQRLREHAPASIADPCL